MSGQKGCRSYPKNWKTNIMCIVLLAMMVFFVIRSSEKKENRILLFLVRPLFFPFGLKRYYYSRNKKCTKLSKKYRDKLGIQYAHFDKQRMIWNAGVFDSAIEVPFEYTTLPIPSGYYEMMTETYGNYMKFPPVEKRGNKHAFEIEPDVPYKEYCGKKYGVVCKD